MPSRRSSLAASSANACRSASTASESGMSSARRTASFASRTATGGFDAMIDA